MKKRNLKSLQLHKRVVSNLQASQVKGGDTMAACTITWGVRLAGELISWYYDCDEEDPVNSSACADTQNDESCQCTVA